MHAVQKLYLYRKSLSTTEFKARGWKVKRCEVCRLDQEFCICNMVKQGDSDYAFLLLMYDNEVLKPSNTGRLIADIVKDTYAFLWKRTEPNTELLDLLNSDKYQPYLIFPKDYANEGQVVFEHKPEQVHTDFSNNKKPLFILIDATWRQAKKIFRKSPYLSQLPIISIPLPSPEEQEAKVKIPGNFDSRYQVRKAAKAGELATAEVAAKVLALMGDDKNALHLDLWFDVFTYQYQRSVKQRSLADPESLPRYDKFIIDNKIT
ncbi:DTW domain-containing protein [Thalassotalea psychrophila]|uniref:tRNA-uridine aminocarboxypropyltransferase n=1 Tax=Thalassotalea psychrophila TaxID=3065647 RepID=A0ABY9U1A0_9GAMM|nr:DTW domain-containing protein [Colwelliaceae bacterium SQ149]